MKRIITLSRQYGSGGRVIGKIVADELGIPFYDKRLITLAAEKSGFSERTFEEAESRTLGAVFNTISSVGNHYGAYELSLNDKVYLAQSEVIRDIAKQGPCVIVGRCADYILASKYDCINVFIHAPLDFRVKRAVEHYGLEPGSAAAKVAKIDKRRASYHNYYADSKWGRSDNYHLSLDSSAAGLENTAKVICQFVRLCGADG